MIAETALAGNFLALAFAPTDMIEASKIAALFKYQKLFAATVADRT